MKKKIRYIYKKFLSEQSPPLFDKLAGVSSIIGLVLSVCSFFGLDLSELGVEHKGFLQILMVWWETQKRTLFVIWVIVIFVVLIMMSIKYRNSTIIKMNASASGLSRIMNKTLDFIDSLNGLEFKEVNEQSETYHQLRTMQRKMLYTSTSVFK